MRKYITLIIVFILVLLSCVGLSACNNNVEKVTVTFDYNVGNLVLSINQQQMAVVKGNIIDKYPGNGLEERKIDGYHIEGWYTAQTDDVGNVLVDDSRFVKLDQKWDFENNRLDEDITLYASWVKNPPKQEVGCRIYLYYQIANGEESCIRVSDRAGGMFYVNEPITSNSYYEEIRSRFEYCTYEGAKYKVLFWYVPKIENRHIMFDENGYAIIDRIWDLKNDVITADMSELVLFANTQLIEE